MPTGKYTRVVKGTLKGGLLKFFDEVGIKQEMERESDILRYIVTEYREYEKIIKLAKAGKIRVPENNT